MSDGGEGLLDVLGGPNRTSIVTGPLGRRVEAAWRLDRRTAVIEMATASGLVLAGGPDGNDPMRATTTGTGELIERAVTEGARHVVVGLGGSATTDGGLGAIQALRSPARLRVDRAGAGLRRAHEVPRRGRRVRRAEGGHGGPDRAALGPPGQPGRPLPAGVRRRRDRRSTAAARPAGWAVGWPPSAAACARASTSSPTTSTSTSASPTRRRRHRRGLPRRPEPRRQGGRRRLRAGARGPDGRSVVIVGDADPSCAEPAVQACGAEVLTLVERDGEHRARTEPRWCIEHAARAALGGR